MVLKQSRVYAGTVKNFLLLLLLLFIHIYIHFALGGRRDAQEKVNDRKKGIENEIPEAYSVEVFFVSDGGKTLLSASQCFVHSAFQTNNGRLVMCVCELVWLWPCMCARNLCVKCVWTTREFRHNRKMAFSCCHFPSIYVI